MEQQSLCPSCQAADNNPYTDANGVRMRACRRCMIQWRDALAAPQPEAEPAARDYQFQIGFHRGFEAGKAASHPPAATRERGLTAHQAFEKWNAVPWTQEFSDEEKLSKSFEAGWNAAQAPQGAESGLRKAVLEEAAQNAPKIVEAVDRVFEKNERLRLGAWLNPQERKEKIAEVIAACLRALAAPSQQADAPPIGYQKIWDTYRCVHCKAEAFSLAEIKHKSDCERPAAPKPSEPQP